MSSFSINNQCRLASWIYNPTRSPSGVWDNDDVTLMMYTLLVNPYVIYVLYMYFQENSTFFIYRAEINMVLNGRDGCNSFWDSVILFLISMTLKQLKLTLAAGWRYISKLKGRSDQFTSNSYYYWAKTLCIGTNQKLVIPGKILSNCLTPNHLNRLQKTSLY